MVSVFILTHEGEWVFWCQCPRRGLPTLLDIARQSNIEADWLGF